MNEKNALVIGIRDEDSLCTAIAYELKNSGYTLYATYQDDSTVESVQRVADSLGIRQLFPYDARKDADLLALGETIRTAGLQFDVLVHGISSSTAAGAKLNLPLVEVSREEFSDAIRVGAFSLVELSGTLLDALKEDGAILALSLRWSKVAVPGFNVVSAAKAGLESIIRGLADSLGRAKRIRVNGIAPGFVPTFSLSKVGNSLEILAAAKERSPLKTGVRREDVASLAVAVLENRSLTAMVYPIDTGVDIMG
ncbi:MAG: SDR family oxidoreductase [Desulfopila sp.]